MRNTGLEEVQTGIKIVGRNNNNLRYADNTILMAESEEELKSFLKTIILNSLSGKSQFSISLGSVSTSRLYIVSLLI